MAEERTVNGALLVVVSLLMGGCASQMVSIRKIPDQTPDADNTAAAAADPAVIDARGCAADVYV